MPCRKSQEWDNSKYSVPEDFDKMMRQIVLLLLFVLCLGSFGETKKVVGTAGEKAVKAYLKKILRIKHILFHLKSVDLCQLKIQCI